MNPAATMKNGFAVAVCDQGQNLVDSLKFNKL